MDILVAHISGGEPTKFHNMQLTSAENVGVEGRFVIYSGIILEPLPGKN